MSVLKNKYSTTLGGNLSNSVWRVPFLEKQNSKKSRNMSQEGFVISSPYKHIIRDPSPSTDNLNETLNMLTQVVSSNQLEIDKVYLSVKPPSNDSLHSISWHKIFSYVQLNHPRLQDCALIISSALFIHFILKGVCRLPQGMTIDELFYASGFFFVGSCALVRNYRPSFIIQVSYLFTILLIAACIYQLFPVGTHNPTNKAYLLQNVTPNLQLHDTTPPVQVNKTAFDFFAFTTANSELPPNFVQAWWHLQHT